MATAAELLVLVDNAITAHLTGGAVESYGVGSRNLRYIPLKELYEMRTKLEARIAAANGGNVSLAEFDR